MKLTILTEKVNLYFGEIWKTEQTPESAERFRRFLDYSCFLLDIMNPNREGREAHKDVYNSCLLACFAVIVRSILKPKLGTIQLT
jgi:hypothetical protein